MKLDSTTSGVLFLKDRVTELGFWAVAAPGAKGRGSGSLSTE